MAKLVSITVQGAAKVNLRLNGAAKKLEKAKPLMRILGQALTSEYGSNIRRGVDAQQRRLARPQLWTRFLSPDVGKANAANESKPALWRTGTLLNSLGPKEITDQHLRFGFQGKYADIAEAMTDGTPGRIKVRSELIKTTQSGTNTGLQYVRILTNSGQWFTKRVRGGYVPVKPQARRFFFLSGRQQRLIEKFATKYVRKAVS